jgi:hypothetical protein
LKHFISVVSNYDVFVAGNQLRPTLPIFISFDITLSNQFWPFLTNCWPIVDQFWPLESQFQPNMTLSWRILTSLDNCLIIMTSFKQFRPFSTTPTVFYCSYSTYLIPDLTTWKKLDNLEPSTLSGRIFQQLKSAPRCYWRTWLNEFWKSSLWLLLFILDIFQQIFDYI